MLNHCYRIVKNELKHFFRLKSRKFSKYLAPNKCKTAPAGSLTAFIEKRKA